MRRARLLPVSVRTILIATGLAALLAAPLAGCGRKAPPKPPAPAEEDAKPATTG